MSEFYIPGVHVFDDAQMLATEAIAAEALTIVEDTYGSGYPLYRGGENGGLAYHNRHHSEALQADTGRMCDALGLTRTERAIGRLAGAAHDIVQLKPRGVMEQESAEWLEAEMHRRGVFPKDVIRVGTLAILGTEPTFENGHLTGQVATQLRYPSRSAELIAKSVAAADLGELYSPAGPLLGHELFKEIQGVTPGDEPDMAQLIDFQREQVQLTERFRYPLPEAEAVFGKLRGEVVAYATEILDDLEQGNITSWDELIARDEAFMHANS